MPETIQRIDLKELKTIRVKIGSVVSEMPIDEVGFSTFLAEQATNRKVSSEAQQLLSNMVMAIAKARDLLAEVSVEFVLPA